MPQDFPPSVAQPSKIAPGLWLGCYPLFAEPKPPDKIVTVVSIMEVAPAQYPEWLRGARKYYARIDDIAGEEESGLTLEGLIELARVVDRARSRGPIYVHCVMGRSRSVTVVCAALMLRAAAEGKQVTARDTLAFVHSKRSEAGPNPYFVSLLRQLEEELELYH